MDIQKEREAFEKYCFDIFLMSPSDGCFEIDDDGFYESLETHRLWKLWQAKSQAVPEGFVLVPRELSADEARKHAEAMFNKVERMARNEQRDLSESEFELFKNRWIDARTLTIQFDWKAMIEAQGQSHE